MLMKRIAQGSAQQSRRATGGPTPPQFFPTLAVLRAWLEAILGGAKKSIAAGASASNTSWSTVRIHTSEQQVTPMSGRDSSWLNRMARCGRQPTGQRGFGRQTTSSWTTQSRQPRENPRGADFLLEYQDEMDLQYSGTFTTLATCTLSGR